jgi:transglutaminase-like putative cysteine protease
MSIKLRIVHETLYLYHEPVKLGPHRLVLRPREGHDLKVESMGLDIQPAFELTWNRDVFGNSIALVDFKERAAELRIVSDVLVTRSEHLLKKSVMPSRDAPRPPVYDPLDRLVASAYQQAIYPEDADAVQAWLKELPFELPRGVRACVGALNDHVHAQFPSKRREERGVLTPKQTLERGSGSCRDLATLLLEAVRSLGIAARFASGYLDCEASELGVASTHAWTETYLPGEGWRGFDPSLGEETDEKHVVTGVSNHPRGVMPVSGNYYGTVDQFRELKVAVRFEKSPVSNTEAHSASMASRASV